MIPSEVQHEELEGEVSAAGESRSEELRDEGLRLGRKRGGGVEVAWDARCQRASARLCRGPVYLS